MLSLTYPVEKVIVSQKFGANPKQYRMYGFPGHEGVDFAVPEGTPVYAAAKGKVTQVFMDNGVHPYGTHVRMRHVLEGKTYETIYAHLSDVLPGVHAGSTIDRGDAIALSGNTGRSTGPHLHFTLKEIGATAAHKTPYPKDVIDPTPYFTEDME